MRHSRIHLGRAVVSAAVFPVVARAAFGAPSAADPGIQEMQIHHLQPDFLDGLLVLAVLLFAMSAVSFITWWNARHISIFRTLAAYLFTIGVIDFVEFRGLSWEWIPAVVFCALSYELFAEALRIPKQPWIWLSRFVWLAMLLIGFFERLDWNRTTLLILWALRLALYPDLILIAIGVFRGGTS